MDNSYLFPHSWKLTGWILLIVGLLLGLDFFMAAVIHVTNGILINDSLTLQVFAVVAEKIFDSKVYFSFIENDINDELIGILIIIGGVLVSFSKVKKEDEFISKIRLDSLVWATYVHYGLLVLWIIFIYGMPFWNFMLFNLFTLLFFFIIRFHWVLYKWKKELKNEK